MDWFHHFDPALDFKLLLAVPAIPLLGYVVNIFFGKRLPRGGDWLLTGGMFVVMCITVAMFFKALNGVGSEGEFLQQSVEHDFAFAWLYKSYAAGQNVVAGILYDPLGAAMLAVVGVVAFCVHLYSIGYMHGDRRYHIFFSNISLFSFAMLSLVLSDNILFLFVFWEIMGLMSYLLIGHFSHDPSNPYFHRWATWASKKAFLTTRVGDVCLLIGMLMFYDEFHTFRFTELWAAMAERVGEHGYESWMTVAGLFLFGGTVGKSAQFPLHIWLPDAMAGPTPVSAMIHAATMVAAGVFLLGRCYPLMTPEVLVVVTVVGAFTALFAATIGMTAFDLKAVLAWSTISQLGFMVAAVGLGGVVAGMFHMVTHAFFKACLFLSAGSVIHGCHHEQDMRKMGGLRRHMPVTFACMLVCTLAISGVPLFSGFYSKDMILKAGYLSVAEQGQGYGWHLFAVIALAVAATLTAFYMFRLIFMTFFGEYRGEVAEHAAHGHGDEHGDHGDHAEHGHHAVVHAHEGGIAHGHPGPIPRESPWTMTAALAVLAFLGLFAGDLWIADPIHKLDFIHPHTWFESLATPATLYGEEVGSWVAPEPVGHEAVEHAEHVEHAAHMSAVRSSLVIAPLGIFLAWLLYSRKRGWPARITGAIGPLYEIVRDKYYVDQFVNVAVIRVCMALAYLQKWIDEHVVDGLVLLVGRVNRAGGSFSAWFDKTFVDGLVNFVGLLAQAFGAIVRLFQTGRIQQYAAFAVAGGLAAAAWLILG